MHEPHCCDTNTQNHHFDSDEIEEVLIFLIKDCEKFAAVKQAQNKYKTLLKLQWIFEILVF